jgi:hypothetical protein
VQRTLTSLIDKGMVHPSLDSPTIYTAVDLETALEAALKKQQSERREMDEKRQELQELSKRQRFQSTDEVSTFKIIKSVKELVADTIGLVGSVKEGFFLDTPKAYLLVVIHLLRWMMSQNSSRASSGLGLARRRRELIFTSLNTALRLHRRSQSH